MEAHRERRWKGGRERGGRVVVTWCFTSSQPVRLYQGDGGGGGGGGDREYVSNLMFYAQSTSTVVSGRDTLCLSLCLSVWAESGACRKKRSA